MSRYSADHVFRGGSYVFHAKWTRAAYRNGDDPSIRYHDLGLRFCRRCV